MKHIVLTGGGTAGHVTPNIAMIPALKEQGFTISYIGSYNVTEETETGCGFLQRRICQCSCCHCGKAL